MTLVTYSALPYAGTGNLTDVNAPDTVVNLSTLLTQEFGADLGGAPTFAVAYRDLDFMLKNDFGYWNPDHLLTSYWTFAGQDIGSLDSGNSQTVPAAAVDAIDYHVGTNIGQEAWIQVPTAFDLAGPTHFIRYEVVNVDTNLMSPTAGSGAPNPSDIVDRANAFASAYTHLLDNNDCGFIAKDVAAAAGATMPAESFSTEPMENQEGGFWRIVYRGDD